MHNEAGQLRSAEQAENKSEAQKFRDVIKQMTQKLEKTHPDEAGEMAGDIRQKLGTSLEESPITAETVQTVSEIMARYITNFEVTFDKKTYPVRKN